MDKKVSDDFHRQYYESMVWCDTKWLGVKCEKTPLDLWVYQEIIFETQPDLIIETGTQFGGSARFLRSMCDLVGNGHIITIDLADHPIASRPDIEYWRGRSSVDPAVLAALKTRLISRPDLRVMVILDSDHSKKHVLAELEAYSEFVSPGFYLIVEDSNVNGHPVVPAHGPGPMEAIVEWCPEKHGFAIDRSREKFFMTWNPCGYLKKL